MKNMTMLAFRFVLFCFVCRDVEDYGILDWKAIQCCNQHHKAILAAAWMVVLKQSRLEAWLKRFQREARTLTVTGLESIPVLF